MANCCHHRHKFTIGIWWLIWTAIVCMKMCIWRKRHLCFRCFYKQIFKRGPSSLTANHKPWYLRILWFNVIFASKILENMHSIQIAHCITLLTLNQNVLIFTEFVYTLKLAPLNFLQLTQMVKCTTLKW